MIRAVSERDAYANLLLPRTLRERGISGRDAALATELCYGTLRALGTLDAVLEAVSSRPWNTVEPAVRDALRLGAYQLLYTRVPAHAAVSTTVALIRQVVGPRATGFGNAVLRRVGETDLDGWAARLAPSDEVGRLALRHAHPEWVVRAFAAALSGDLDQTAAVLEADNWRPRVHLAALPGRIDQAALAAEVAGEPGRYSRFAVYLKSGDPADLAAVAERRAIVQDEGSQLVATALAEAPVTGRDDRWLDLCAGPGGKSALLGALAAQRGGHLTAVEVAEHRARLVADLTSGLPVTVVHADGRQVGADSRLPAAGFDRVLVDAPCTGLGALRRRPEARWRRDPEDVSGLHQLQRELLMAGLRAVRPGGVLGYVTCSPHPEETSRVVAAVVAELGDSVHQLDARSLMPGMSPPHNGQDMQLWPHRHGTDAMYLALLRRVS